MFNRDNVQVSDIYFSSLEKEIKKYTEIFGYWNRNEKVFINEKTYWDKLLRALELNLSDINERLKELENWPIGMKVKSLDLLSLVVYQILLTRIIKIYVNVNSDLKKDEEFFENMLKVLKKNLEKPKMRDIIEKCLMSDEELLEHEDMIDLSVANIDMFMGKMEEDDIFSFDKKEVKQEEGILDDIIWKLIKDFEKKQKGGVAIEIELPTGKVEEVEKILKEFSDKVEAKNLKEERKKEETNNKVPKKRGRGRPRKVK